MHEHTYTVVIEWRWMAVVRKIAMPLNGLTNSTGMIATKLMCPCGDIKEMKDIK